MRLSTRRFAHRVTLLAVALPAVLAFIGCGGTTTAPGVITPGQRLVAFVSDRDGSLDIFFYDLDADIFVGLPNLNGAGVERKPAVSLDGRVLAYVSDRPGMGGLDIHVYDLAQSMPATPPPINTAGDEDDPSFTGDALKLAFTRDTLGFKRIRLFNGSTSRFIPLPGLDTTGTFDDFAPAPTQTGVLIAFVSNRNGNDDVFVYDATGDSLLDLPDLRSDSLDTEPTITPDGRWLCFASNRAGGSGDMDLYLYDLQMKAFMALSRA